MRGALAARSSGGGYYRWLRAAFSSSSDGFLANRAKSYSRGNVPHLITVFRVPWTTRGVDLVLARSVSSFSAAAADRTVTDRTVEELQQKSFAASSLSAIRGGIQHYGRCYWELSKARLSILVVLTSGAGYVLGSGSAIDLAGLGWTCLGTMLAAASANTFNQIIEINNDATMKRTMRRPLPSGRISIEHAFGWALSTGVLGVSLLACKTNGIVAVLGASNIMLYTMAYTPLKQLHPVNTWVGAIVGAVPPLMGWAAASGQLDPGAWVLSAALYYWQLPHFMALSYICSKDYLSGGYQMVSGRKAAAVALRNCLYLLPIGFIAHKVGVSSSYFGVEALAMTLAMGYSAGVFYCEPSTQTARNLFRSSLLYLPVLMLAMLVHRVPNPAVNQEDEYLDQMITRAALVDETAETLKDPATKVVEKAALQQLVKPPIAYASAAPFPFLPVPKFP